MPYVIAQPCIDVMDKSCIEECPVDCIYEGERKLYINAKECIDCGACEPVCPVEAISQDRRVPDDQTEFVQDNIRFFTEVLPGRDAPLGAPGGSHSTGPIGVDTPVRGGPVSAVPGEGLATVTVPGRPAAELSDGELESQGTQAHATRNWVFLHGTAEQFARHTSRMLELEQEYLRRHPQRTWQGSGGAPTGDGDEAASLREALRGIVMQLDALAAEPLPSGHQVSRAVDPVLLVLADVAARPGGRLHKLEVHQAAREARLDRASLAALYTAVEPLLATDGADRVITDAGRERLRAAGWASGSLPAPRPSGSWAWEHQERAVWDDDKQRIVGAAPDGVFDVAYRSGESLPGDWWVVRDETATDGRAVAYGWMDVTWGEAEILLAVEPDAQRAGLGSFVLEHLEREAADRGLNYVYNTVRDTHPRRDEVHDWLGVRGYRGEADDHTLRKRVQGSGDTAGGTPPARAPRDRHAGSDLGPGREDSGGYVDVDDHSY